MKINYQLRQPDFARDIRRMSDDFHKELKGEVVAATRQVSLNAKSFAPVDKGGLRSSIRVANKGLSGEVSVGVEYGPYQEYGTGTKVKVPSELKSYAMQFKGKGIREVNTRAQPYLYPAFFIQRDKFIKALDRMFDRVKNKHWK